MLKAVLFDMDGVLFDSMPNHAYAWSHAMTQFGLEMTAYEAYLHEGRTGSGTINILAHRYWGRDATPEEIERMLQRLRCSTPVLSLSRCPVPSRL